MSKALYMSIFSHIPSKSRLSVLGLFLFVLLRLNCQLKAQPTTFSYFSKKDGLSQSSVFAIAQDEVGFLWFGTKDGLNRYDGKQFKVYKNDTFPNSLVANDIRTIFVDKTDHTLWIGTTTGLSKYNPSTDDFTNFLHDATDSTSLSQNVIRTIFRDSKGRLWVGTSNGLNLWNKNTNQFSRFYFKNESGIESSLDVKTILEDHLGQLWFGTADGLFQLTDQLPYSFKRIDKSPKLQLSDTYIKTMVEDKNYNIWIGTNKAGLHAWNPLTQKLILFQSNPKKTNTLSHNKIRTLCLDPKGGIWIGTFDGLNYLNQDTVFTKFGKKQNETSGLSDKSIHSLLIDQQGSLWVGTYYGGINQLNKNNNRFFNFHRTQQKNALSADIISSFAEDHHGNIWIGTEGGGLNFYDQSTDQFTSYQNQQEKANTISGNNVKKVLLDSDTLWIGIFQGGLNIFNIKNKKFTILKHNPNNKNSLSHNNVYNLHKEDQLLWILTYGGGLDILDLRKMVFHHFQNNAGDSQSLSSNLTRTFLKTSHHQFWIGTDKGLNKVFLDQQGFPKRMETILPNEKIYSLQEDSHHHIWIGTFSNGLYELDPKTNNLHHFTMQDGLPGNAILGILEPNQNELWLSTNNGLSKLNTKQKIFTNYNIFNGLHNSEYNFNAYYQTQSGDLLFGGMNGFTRFNPKTIKQNDFIPPIVFTDLRQNNQSVTIKEKGSILKQNINETQELEFKYNEANFTIQFAALDYSSPQNNRYAYRLDGFDKDWNYTIGETEATYTIQRDGEYIFQLKAANSDGLWSPQERQIKILVLPPLYRSWWAYLIYFLILISLAYGLVRFIRLRHKLQLELISKKQQKDLHEAKLRFFTNITHEFRTPLTLVLGPINELLSKKNNPPETRNQLTLIQRNAKRLLMLVNQILTFRKLDSDHEPLKIIHENMVPFLKEIFLLFKESAQLHQMDYRFETQSDQIFAWFDPDKIERVFFNLLANAFKFTPDGGKITMVIQEINDKIEIKIIDNGPGIDPELKALVFERFYKKANSHPLTPQGSGIGLAICKQMIDLHKGHIFVETTTTQGATFVVHLLKGKSHFNDSDVIQVIHPKSPLSNFNLVERPPIEIPEAAINLNTTKILIVEDNLEIRDYIQQIFNQDYHTFLAKNGKEALDITKHINPDIIVSDVMMPIMDGITFCQKLKSDIEISHIPIVLLTARTADIFKIEGLQMGADDYLTKPFNPEELRLRIQNILATRQKLKEHFAQASSLPEKDLNITSVDEKFLIKAYQIVEKNIGNELFNVLLFASELAVSRALLFTKLKALTGQTPNNFIKDIRLKYAAKLLATNKLNVSEVADRVGFKDPKYFRKCFIEKFGVSPSRHGKGAE